MVGVGERAAAAVVTSRGSRTSGRITVTPISSGPHAPPRPAASSEGASHGDVRDARLAVLLADGLVAGPLVEAARGHLGVQLDLPAPARAACRCSSSAPRPRARSRGRRRRWPSARSRPCHRRPAAAAGRWPPRRPATSRLSAWTAVASPVVLLDLRRHPLLLDEDPVAQRRRSPASPPGPATVADGRVTRAPRPAGSTRAGTSRNRRSTAACSSTGSSSEPVSRYSAAITPPRTPVVSDAGPPLVGVREPEGDRRDDAPARAPTGRPRAPDTTARKKPAVQPLLADPGGHAHQREQPPLPAVRGSRASVACAAGSRVPAFARPAHRRQRSRISAPPRSARVETTTKSSTSDEHGGGDRPGPARRPAQTRPRRRRRPGASSQIDQDEDRQSPLQDQQPPVERPAGVADRCAAAPRSAGAAPARPAARRRPGSRRRRPPPAPRGRSRRARPAGTRRAGSGLGAQDGQRAGEVGRVLAGELDPSPVGRVRRTRAGRRAATAARRPSRAARVGSAP